MSRYVGLQQQIVSSVDDDLKMGVVILGNARITCQMTLFATLPGWTAGSRYETRTWKARTQQCINSPPTGSHAQEEGKGKGERKGHSNATSGRNATTIPSKGKG